MKLYLLVLAACALSSCGLREENAPPTAFDCIDCIDGPANVRSTPNGEILFELYDGIAVEIGHAEGDWHPVGVYVDVPDGLVPGDTLPANIDLTIEGELIGRTQAACPIYFGWSNAYLMVGGYTHKQNIAAASTQEHRLQAILKNREKPISKAEVGKEVEALGFEWASSNGYEVAYFYESVLHDPSPMYRLGLVFENDTLIAVLHSRPLEIPGMKDNPLPRGFDVLSYPNADTAVVARWRWFVQSVD